METCDISSQRKNIAQQLFHWRILKWGRFKISIEFKPTNIFSSNKFAIFVVVNVFSLHSNKNYRSWENATKIKPTYHLTNRSPEHHFARLETKRKRAVDRYAIVRQGKGVRRAGKRTGMSREMAGSDAFKYLRFLSPDTALLWGGRCYAKMRKVAQETRWVSVVAIGNWTPQARMNPHQHQTARAATMDPYVPPHK